MRISDWSSDVCSSDLDRTVSEGLGMRWSFMGPFETIDLNAPGGVADYAERLGPLYHSIAMDRRHPAQWQPDLIERVAAERRQALPLEDLASRCDWRRSEEHTSELQSLLRISYAVFCLKKNTIIRILIHITSCL